MLSLDPLLALCGPFSLHLSMLDAALTQSQDAQPQLLARGYEARGRARHARYRLNEAREDYDVVLRIARESKSADLEGRAEYGLGDVTRAMGRVEQAQGH